MGNSLSSAVNFAAKLIRDGEYYTKAVRIAAGYYRVSESEVRSGLSSRAGKSRKGKKIIKPEQTCVKCNSASANWRMKVLVDAGHTAVENWFFCNECVEKYGRGGLLNFRDDTWGNDRRCFYETKWTRYTPTKDKSKECTTAGASTTTGK